MPHLPQKPKLNPRVILTTEQTIHLDEHLHRHRERITGADEQSAHERGRAYGAIERIRKGEMTVSEHNKWARLFNLEPWPVEGATEKNPAKKQERGTVASDQLYTRLNLAIQRNVGSKQEFIAARRAILAGTLSHEMRARLEAELERLLK